MDTSDPKKVVKLTVNLSADVYEALQSLASQQATTVTDALRRAIGTEKFLRDEVNKGSKVLIQDSDKTLKQVLLR